MKNLFLRWCLLNHSAKWCDLSPSSPPALTLTSALHGFPESAYFAPVLRQTPPPELRFALVVHTRDQPGESESGDWVRVWVADQSECEGWALLEYEWGVEERGINHYITAALVTSSHSIPPLLPLQTGTHVTHRVVGLYYCCLDQSLHYYDSVRWS